jgi:hypothetical protein
MARNRKRCLIVERHEWETGARQQQLQFVLEPARRFFGPGAADRTIGVRLFIPPSAPTATAERKIVISREYQNGTRRTNAFPEMGGFPAGFVFFEETHDPGMYDVWWQTDAQVVAARYTGWEQGRNTQYGRGRLSVIVTAPVPRPIVRIG